MAKINLLPKHIAELIAAGEVVERPASVVKELMENAVDAGATTITLEIRGGGVQYIRITDNGCGIDHEDVPKAFLSHTTSKVKTEQDLNSIFTLGFRGEALASIAAVSRTEVLTKTAEDTLGTTYSIAGGVQNTYDRAGCPDGTTVVVRDLFYNTPARMKFLKKDVYEANAVADVVDKIALSHPEISVRFIREGKQALITPGDGKLMSVIYSVFGRTFAESLIPVDYHLDGVDVEGFVCKPSSSRPSRAMQYFFLNGRYIKSRSCAASMENAYKNSVMVGKFPSCVLNIRVRPEVVDVNVHPAKTEVRFSDERKVSSAVYFAVKSAIDAHDTMPEVDLSRAAKLTRKAIPEAIQLILDEDPAPAAPKSPVTLPPKAEPGVKAKPKENFWGKMSAGEYTSSAEKKGFSSEKTKKTEDSAPDLIKEFRQKKAQESREKSVAEKPKPNLFVSETTAPHTEKEAEEKAKPAAEPVKKQPETTAVKVTTADKLPPKPLRLLGEVFKTYIICEYDNKVILIDKHAAHERIIYNKMKKAAKENIASQVLLTPVRVVLNKNEYSIVLENLEVFRSAGYLIEDFGAGSVLVRESPMLIDGDCVEDTVIEIASYLAENKTDVESEKIDRIHHTAACKAAIKAGFKNSTAEMKALAEQVLYDDSVRYCPHGRPVMIELSKYELEKQFGRIQ
ncbi:MAG: DNA mismatch repair endonuclease MutL [Oscillospiraceae bacterium]|nr:DNA mismatch repair endonuclease MutL [Oscillospiraceae bacterium]